MTDTSPTILVVDDEADLREAIAFDFRRKKFHVLTASCGSEAIKIVESEKVDIVVSDVRMPNGDGIELLDKIKARNAFLPVVMFITGFADISIEEAYDKGADAVFAKPFDRKILFEAVMRAIQPIDRRLQRKASRVDVDLIVGMKFLKSGFSIETRSKNMGRGGMFVELKDRFPELSEETEFQIESESDRTLKINGRGIIRWVRQSPAENLQPGCGVEFLELNPECIRQVIELINFAKTKSFIPRQ